MLIRREKAIHHKSLGNHRCQRAHIDELFLHRFYTFGVVAKDFIPEKRLYTQLHLM